LLPEFVHEVSNKKLDFKGYLVIDSMVYNRSSGGVRMSSTVTLNEVSSLARNMTLKFGFLGIPKGGAKAGIQFNGILSRNRKKLILAEFGKSLSRFIGDNLFSPGTDMGTSDEDIAWLTNAAKGQRNGRLNIESGKGPKYTSWTMVNSARQAIRIENANVAIVGFGKIGSQAAQTFSENGARVVAISTFKGAIYNPKGLNIDMLIDLRNKYGDDVVNAYCGARKMSKDRLFQLPVDILLPCAGSWTINSTKAQKIRAKVICPGANIPLTYQAEQDLFKRGIVCLPDFVSNSGAVLGGYMANYVGMKEMKEIIDKKFSQSVYELLRISMERNICPKKVAIEIAIRRFYEIKRCKRRRFLHAVRLVLPDAYLRIIGKAVAPYVLR